MAWCATSGSDSSGVVIVVVEYAAEAPTACDSAARGCVVLRGQSDKLVVDILVKDLPEVALAQGNDAGQALSRADWDGEIASGGAGSGKETSVFGRVAPGFERA